MKNFFLTTLLITSICLIASGCSRGVTKVVGGIAKSGTKRSGQAFVLKEIIEQGTKIPAKYKDYTQTNIRPNANGKWEIRELGGHSKHIDEFATVDSTLYKEQVFTVRSIDITPGVGTLDNLPKHVPIVIQSKNNRFYEYIRPTALTNSKAALRYQNLKINLADNFKINDAIHLLEKPVYSNKTRFIELTSEAGYSLENVTLPSGFSIEKATKNNFLDNLRAIKHQTITLSGRIDNDNLEGVALDSIKKIAQENKLNLVIVESTQPEITLLGLAARNADMRDPKLAVGNQVGNFFNQFTNTSKRSKEFVELNVNPDKNSFFALNLKAERPNNPPKIRAGQDIDIHASMEFSHRLQIKAIEIFLENAAEEVVKGLEQEPQPVK